MTKAFGGGISTVVLILVVQISAAAQDLGVRQYSPDDVRIRQCDSYQNPLPLYRYCRPCSDNEPTYGEGGCPLQNNPSESRCCHPAIQSPNENSGPQFVYKLTVSNEGTKTIRAVEWDYVFIDPATRAEVARHQFLSEQKLCPSKRKTLVEYSTSPPTKVISIAQLSQPRSERFLERVVIRRVMYQDGSVWEPKLIQERDPAR